MPAHHRFEPGLVRLVVEGEHTVEQDLESLSEALADGGFVDGTHVLIEFSGSAQPWSINDMRNLAQFLATRKERIGARCAVAVSSSLQYGLARMLAAFTDGVDVSVFRDNGQARRWLTDSFAFPPPRDDQPSRDD